MPKEHPAQEDIAAFSKEWQQQGRRLVGEIRQRLHEGQGIDEAVNAAVKKLDIPGGFRKAIMKTVVGSLDKGGLLVVGNPIGFQNWYLNKHWHGEEFSLSQRIAQGKYKSIIKDTLKTQLRTGTAFTKTAKAITDTDLIKGDVSSKINELNRLARRVAQGDPDAQQAYTEATTAARRHVARLARNGAPTKALKSAYESVIKASESLNTAQMDKAIERAVQRKARYNAERIARTEAARAYGVATQQAAAEDPDVKGIQWELSPDHNVIDICDLNSEADLFGMGKGIYPIDQIPEYPAHPHCLCLLEEVYSVDDKEPEPIEDTLDDMNAEEQNALMGTEGAANFRKTGKWKGNIKQFSGPTEQEKIPEKFVQSVEGLRGNYVAELLVKQTYTDAQIMAMVDQRFPQLKMFPRKVERIRKQINAGKRTGFEKPATPIVRIKTAGAAKPAAAPVPVVKKPEVKTEEKTTKNWEEKHTEDWSKIDSVEKTTEYMTNEHKALAPYFHGMEAKVNKSLSAKETRVKFFDVPNATKQSKHIAFVKKMEIEKAQEIYKNQMKQIDYLLKRYPKLSRSLTGSGQSSTTGISYSSGKAYATVTHAKNSRYCRLELNEGWYEDPLVYNQNLERDVRIGYKPKGCEDPLTSVTHEFGHIITQMYDSTAKSQLSKRTLELFDEFFKDKTVYKKAYTVSGYAKANINETFAETFRSYHHTKKESWGELVNMFEELFKALDDDLK